MRYLKQSTQVTKLIGPHLDKTDGVTEEVGLAGVATEISKNGAAFGAGPVLGTHDSDGWYPVVLTTTHTDTIGDLLIKVHDAATHLPVWAEFHVLAANVYDSLFGAATDKLDVNVEEWNTTAVPAEHTAGYPIVTVKDGTGTGEINTNAGAIALVDLVTTTTTATTATNVTTVNGLAAGVITAAAIADGAIDRATFAADTGLQSVRSNTAQAGGATSITLDASASATTDFYKHCLVYLTGGTGAGQYRICTAYNGTTKAATVTPAWATNPDATSTFAVLPAGIVNAEALGGDSQSLADLKDFADAGYDPATNKVQGVVLTDTLTTYTGNTPQTGDSFARLGAAGAGLTDLGGMSTTMKAQVQTEAEDALAAYHVVLQKTTIATLASQTSFTLTAGSADNDAYNDCVLVIEDSATAAQKAVAVIDDYTGATRTLTLRTDPAVFTMAAGDVVTIRADRALKPAVMNRTLDVNAGGHVARVTLTDTLTTYTGDTPQTGDSFARIGATGSGLTSLAQASVCTEARLAELAAANIPADVDTLLSRLTATRAGYLDNISAAAPTVAQIWTTALTEAYRATGATGTAAQLLYELLAHLGEFANSGTTKTLKKLDGSTTAKTFTYDSASAPTSITETT